MKRRTFILGGIGTLGMLAGGGALFAAADMPEIDIYHTKWSC